MAKLSKKYYQTINNNNKGAKMNNIISINQDLFRLWLNGHLTAFRIMSRNQQSINAIKALNDNSKELERLGQNRYGPEYKSQQYKLIDFFL